MRARKVRLRYPEPFIDLAKIFAALCDAKVVAAELSVPLSTVYRWTSAARPARAAIRSKLLVEFDNDHVPRVEALLAGCEEQGFDMRRHLKNLLPDVFKKLVQRPAAIALGQSYSFLGELKDQVVVGEIIFPRSRFEKIETMTSIVDVRDKSGRTLRQRMLLAKMEIDQHYYTRLSCGQLGELVGMNRFNFIRGFRSVFGVSPFQYVNQVRVEHAKHMLTLTNQPLNLIAASVGFSTASSLNRAFKRFAGASPANLVSKIGSDVAARSGIAA